MTVYRLSRALKRLPARQLPACIALARYQHTIHSQPANIIEKPLAEPTEPQEAQLKAHGDMQHHEKIHDDVYDDSKDFSAWRWAALVGSVAALLYYQERCINDERYTIAGYDMDQIKTFREDYERSALWRALKPIFAVPYAPVETTYARIGPLLKEEMRHVESFHVEQDYARPRVRRIEANGAGMIERPFLFRVGPVVDNPGVTIDGMEVSKEQAWPSRPPSPAQMQDDGGEVKDGEGQEDAEDDTGHEREGDSDT